jgi:hypothetical protein
VHPKKKQEKTARFFRGFPGDFPGDFPGISRGLFSEKTPVFLDFRPVLPKGILLRSARFVKNPQISRKVPEDFRNSWESPEKISRNSRKFRPTGFFGKFPEFSGFSGVRTVSDKTQSGIRISSSKNWYVNVTFPEKTGAYVFKP